MITIVDYGLGNIRAFQNVYKRLNVEIKLASSVADLSSASKIILPGVGAFDHAMEMLNQSGMRDCLDNMVLVHKVPVIGICVGMQMMANSSDEGVSQGLGWIDGVVTSLDSSRAINSIDLPLPHMGWNNIEAKQDSVLFKDLDAQKNFYFLHSYYFQCNNSSNVLATSNYGFDFACVVNKENIYGIQCHPEKSHHNGVALLKNFAEL